MRYQDIPQFTRTAGYAVDHHWKYMETTIQQYIADWGLDLNPDFQRAHVWNETQQIRYVEYVLRGGITGLDIYTNCPGWRHGRPGDFVVVDGKQRLQAVRRFLVNEIPVFGHTVSQIEGYIPMHARFRWHVNDLQTRAEVLTWYLEFNSAGTPHTEDELARVRALLDVELANGGGDA